MSSRVGHDDGDECRAACSSAARELARREGFAAAEAVCVLLARRGPLAARRSGRRRGAADRERGGVPRARRLARAGPVAVEHRRNARRGPREAGRACGSSSRRPATVHRDLVRRGGRLRARQPGHDRAPARSARARRGAARGGRRAVRPDERPAGAGRRARAARLSRACTGRHRRVRAGALERALELRREHARSAWSRDGAVAGSGSWRPSAVTTTRRSSRSPRPAICSAAPATVGDWSARFGGRPTWRSRASVSTRPTRRSRKRARWSGRPTAKAGSR